MFHNVLDQQLLFSLLEKFMVGNEISVETKQLMWHDALEQHKALKVIAKWTPLC
jgi:hypothetical protein